MAAKMPFLNILAASAEAEPKLQCEPKADETMKTEASETKEPKEPVEEKPTRAEHLCCFSRKECNLEKLKGFDFCHKHILEDKASPFKPCSFVSKTTGKKCPNPAPNLSGKEKTYCLIHGRDSDLRKAIEERSKKRKRKQSEKSEANDNVAKQTKNHSKKLKIDEQDEIPRADDMLRVDGSWHGDHESDTESLDNEIDEPLRHAGVWTAEEVTKVCRDKLLRLRSLYMSQFERLKHVFKKKRRKYILATKGQEEGTGETNAVKKTVSSFDNAMKSYNKRYRTDALLHKQSKERRLGGTASKGHHPIPPQHRCTHYTEGNRCVLKVLASTRFCRKHICHDPNQVLFLPCSHVQGSNNLQCGTPVPNVLPHDKCLFHLPHSSLTADALQEQLNEAKELQATKEKKKEEKRKLELEKKESIATIVVKMEAEPSCESSAPTSSLQTNTAENAPSVSLPSSTSAGLQDLQSKAAGSTTNPTNPPSTKDPSIGANTPTLSTNGTSSTSTLQPTTTSNLSAASDQPDLKTDAAPTETLPATTSTQDTLKKESTLSSSVPPVINKEEKEQSKETSCNETKLVPTQCAVDPSKNDNKETVKEASENTKENTESTKDLARKDST